MYTGDVYEFEVLPDASCQYLDPTTFVITLPMGASCQLDYFFNPGVLGARSATITLVDADSAPVASVAVSGTGTISYYQVSAGARWRASATPVSSVDTSGTPLNQPDRRGWPRPATTVAIGSPPPTAASSTTATPPSRAPPAAFP